MHAKWNAFDLFLCLLFFHAQSTRQNIREEEEADEKKIGAIVFYGIS